MTIQTELNKDDTHGHKTGWEKSYTRTSHQYSVLTHYAIGAPQLSSRDPLPTTKVTGLSEPRNHVNPQKLG